MKNIDADVVIIGSGPVGMVLALDLASRGVSVVMAESRAEGEPPSVKCNHVSARSMEILRRLGVAGDVRAAGLPPDYPHDVSYRTTTTGREVTRIRIAARAERGTARDDGPDSGWPTPEPPHRINQIYLEPVIARHVAAHPLIRSFFRHEVVDFAQDAEGASVRARDIDSGAEVRLSGKFLVGCDGGRSATRRFIGATLQGDAVIQRVQSTYIRAPGLIDRMQVAPAWCMFSVNPRRSGNIYSIDGRELWLVHNYLRDNEADFDSVDRDRSIRDILGVDDGFAYEVIRNEDWYGRRLVTDKMREGRVFICGDAAHLWVPYAGYGMNAGIADAANLAWILAAHLRGWAPDSILDAHEAERLPITEQVSRFAMNHCIAMASKRASVPDDIESDTPEATARREAFGAALYQLNVQQYCCGGLNFGYYYDASPLIAYDDETPPTYGMADFTSSIVPGCRAPHLWLRDGRSLYDVIGGDHALLCLEGEGDAARVAAAAETVGMPFRVVTVQSDDPLRAVYTSRFVVVRPDQHVAWRGDALPDDPAALIDLLRGAGRADQGRQGLETAAQ